MRDALRNSDGRALATPFNLRKHCPTHTRQLRELLERQIALFPKGSNSITKCATHRVLSCSLLRRWPSHTGSPFCSHCSSHTLPRSQPNSIDSVPRETAGRPVTSAWTLRRTHYPKIETQEVHLNQAGCDFLETWIFQSIPVSSIID